MDGRGPGGPEDTPGPGLGFSANLSIPRVKQTLASSADTAAAHFEREAANSVPSGNVGQLYAALDAPEVIQALGIPPRSEVLRSSNCSNRRFST